MFVFVSLSESQRSLEIRQHWCTSVCTQGRKILEMPFKDVIVEVKCLKRREDEWRMSGSCSGFTQANQTSQSTEGKNLKEPSLR